MKRAFVIFALIILLLTGGLIVYLQSPAFAHFAKGLIARYLPKDLGINGDFSEFAIKVYPPGVSVLNPTLKVVGKNSLQLPVGMTGQAKRLDLTFRLFQTFAGTIRVNNVNILDGEIFLPLAADKEPKKQHSRLPSLQWDELFQIHVEGISLENTRLNLQNDTPHINAQLLARKLALTQWSGRSGLGYEAELDLSDIQGEFPKEWSLPPQVVGLRGHLLVNPLGVQVGELTLTGSGSELTLDGDIVGNLLNPKGLKADFKLKAHGQLDQTLSSFFPSKKAPPVSGEFNFDGKIQAILERFLETAQAQGQLTLKQPRYQTWSADDVKVDLKWSARENGSELSIEGGSIHAEEKPRIGGVQPGNGGIITLRPFQVSFSPRFNLLSHIKVPVHLDRAHLHWLAAPAIKDVFAMDFRASGSLLVDFGLSSDPEEYPWTAQVETNLVIEKFQLDNQRWGLKRPLKRVLHFPKINLAGDFEINPDAVIPQDVSVSLPHTQLKVGGEIDFTTGYNLHATGPTNLADFESIAENKIAGDGAITVHVHGPSSAVLVDIDADLRNAFYLNLYLGSLKGRITWADDPQDLIFTQVHLQQGQTAYDGQGKIALGQKEFVQLGFNFTKGTTQDLMEIFKSFTKDFWWFPASLTGNLSGQLEVSGGLSMDELKALGQFQGTDWSYFGERFKSVQLTGGYDRGAYLLSDIQAQKIQGNIKGHLTFSADKEFDWDLRTEGFSVTDWDHVARLNIPVRGRMVSTSKGRGKEGAIQSDTRLSITSFAVRGSPLPPSQLSVRSENGVLLVSGSVLGGQGLLDLIYDFKLNNKSSIRVEAKNFDYSPFLLLLNPRLAQETQLQAVATGLLQVNFLSGKGEFGTGRLELSRFDLSKSNSALHLARPMNVSIQEGSFIIPDLAFETPQGEAVVDLRGQHAQLSGTVTGALDLSILELLVSSVAQASGPIRLNMDLGGNLREPLVNGVATLENGALRIHALDSPFENIRGTIQLKQNVVTVQKLESDLSGGTLSASGNVQIFADRFPTLNLQAKIASTKLTFFPFLYAQTSGLLTVVGDRPPYTVGGDITIESALSKTKVMSQKSSQTLQATQYMPPAATVGEGGLPLFRLDINTHAERGILVQNDLFDAELKGQLKVVNTLETPRVMGTASMIRGKMVFKNRFFEIQSANATFDSPNVINPSFDMTATTEVNNTKVLLYASGRLEKWKIELSSTPSLPESEILSMLALGTSSSEARKTSTGDRSAVEQGEAASLLLHSLDFNRELESKTGFQIQVGESTVPQTGTSVSRAQTPQDTAVSPKIVIRSQVGKNLDISVGTTVGVGSSNRREINAEYKVTPNFSIMGVYDKYDTTSPASSTVQETNAYGVDFKWQTRFK